jgi:hypothetical protein
VSTGGRFAVVAALLVALGVIAGCAAPTSSGPAPSPRVTCVAIPTEKCDEAVASVMRSLLDTSPEAIDVTCVSSGCTSSAGSMDTVVTLSGGRQLHANPLTWGNGGGPQLPPVVPGMPPLPVAPICVGIPDDMCRQMAGGEFPEAALHGGVVKIVVSCTRKPCTNQKGEGTTVVTFGDGTENDSGSWGYENASGG